MERAREHEMGERQRRFADYFLETGNARQSAIRAGYTPNYASKLRQTPAIAAYIQQRLDEMDDERIASAKEVLKYLTAVMRGTEQKGDVSRMKAAELLGKRLGAFNEPSLDASEAPVIVDDIPADSFRECADE